MDNFDSLSVETVSMCTQLLTELYLAQKKGSNKLTFGSTTIEINSNFNIMLTMSTKQYTSLPSGMREYYRPITMYRPDRHAVVNQLMLTSGFNKDNELSSLVLKLVDCAKTQFYNRRVDVPLNELKAIIREAGENMHKAKNERGALLSAIKNFIMPQLVGEDKYIWQMILINIFGPTSQPPASEDKAAVATNYYKVRSLNLSEETLASVLDCYEVMSRWKAICVLDTDSPGKTVALECIKHMMGKLNHNHVSSKTLLPKSYPLYELYGQYENDPSSGQRTYKPGIIQKVITELSTQFPSAVDEDTGRVHTVYNEKNVQRWLMLDGIASSDWMAGFSTAMDNQDGFIMLPNYEKLVVPANMKLVFKSVSLHNASASAVTRIGLVSLMSTYSWKDIMNSVLESLSVDIPILNDRLIIKKLTDSILKFFDFLIEGNGISSLEWIIKISARDLANNYIRTLSSMIRHFFDSNYDTDDHYLKLESITSGMAFVTLWTAVGTLVKESSQGKFEQLVEDKLTHFMSTDSKNLRSKCVNPTTFFCDTCKKAFEPLVDQLGIESTFLPELYHNLRVISPQSLWRSTVMSRLLESKANVMILSSRQSSIDSVIYQATKNLISASGSNKQRINMKWTLGYKGKDLTDHLKLAMTPKSKKQYVSANPTGAIVVVEDINMPQPDQFGEIECLERLRELVASKTYTDFVIGEEVTLDSLLYLATADPRISNLESLRRQHRRKFLLSNLSDCSEQDFKDTIFEIVKKNCAVSFANYITDDILAEVSQTAAAIVWSIKSEGERLVDRKVLAESSINNNRLFDLTAAVSCFKSGIDRELEYVKVLINSFICYLVSEAKDQTDSQKTMLTFMQQCLAKSYRGFEWNGFEIDQYRISILTDSEGSLQLSLGTNQENFKTHVKKLINKEKKAFEGYHLLPETVDCLYSCVSSLWQPGSKILVLGKPGSGKEHMLKATGLLLSMTVVSLELVSDADQHLAIKNQLSKIVADCLTLKRRHLVIVKLSAIRSLSVLRLLQDIFELGVSACLDVDKSKLRDAMLMADYHKDYATFLKDYLALNCRLAFIDDLIESNESIENKNWYQIVRNCRLLVVEGWKKASFEQVAVEVMEGYQELDMSETDKKLSAEAITAIHSACQAAVEDSAAISQRSFEQACRYMCDFKVKSKVEIKDQLRNIQTGVARNKSLLKLSDELIAKEKEVAAKMTEKKKELEALTQEIEAAQEEARQRKGTFIEEHKKLADYFEEMEAEMKVLKRDTSVLDEYQESVTDAAKCITRGDITEVKSFSNPPDIVQRVLICVSLILNEKGEWNFAKNVVFSNTS